MATVSSLFSEVLILIVAELDEIVEMFETVMATLNKSIKRLMWKVVESLVCFTMMPLCYFVNVLEFFSGHCGLRSELLDACWQFPPFELDPERHAYPTLYLQSEQPVI